MIGKDTEINGNIMFQGGLHIDGKVVGDILSSVDGVNGLTISELGCVEGDIRVQNIVINGEIIGNVYSSCHLELAAKANITGSVYYNLLEIARGAEINGSLVHEVEKPMLALSDHRENDVDGENKKVDEEIVTPLQEEKTQDVSKIKVVD